MAGMGVFFPFCSLYLSQELSFSASQVGSLLAAVPLAGLVAQPLWGLFADRSGSRKGVLLMLSLGAAVAALVLSRQTAYGTVWVGLVSFALFHTAVLPTATSVTLERVGVAAYGFFRMWGTLGFLVLVVSFPLLSRLFGDPSGMDLLFPMVAVLSLAAALWVLFLPASPFPEAKARKGDAARLWRHPPVARLLAMVFLIHCFIQGPIYLFPLYVASRGGDASTVSRMWILMLVLEIPLIAFSGRTLKRLGARGLLTLGLATEALRWTTCAFTTDLRIIAAVQLLHGVGVAGILVGAPLYLERCTPEATRSTGQAWVSMAGAGAGAIVSNLMAGALMDRVSVEAPYVLAGAVALAMAFSVHRLLPEPRKPESESGLG
ncbi:MAG: MFS transporter [Deltaproteobacteria bacterium]|nr:MFS transporter [Deltaproteobacteria bacterium]